MTNAILYGTTSDNNLKPVRCSDSGELVVEGGDGYWTLDGSTISTVYDIQADDGSWSFSSDGDGYCKRQFTFGVFEQTFAGKITTSGSAVFGNGGDVQNPLNSNSWVFLATSGYIRVKAATTGDNAQSASSSGFSITWGEKVTSSIRMDGTIYCKTVVDSDGYELSNVAQGLIALRNAVLATSDLDELKALIFSTLMEIKPVPIPPDDPPE